MNATCALPYELERDIFELAYLEHPECALQLLLTARRVHIWWACLLFIFFQFTNHCLFRRTEPLLYRVLRFSDRKITPPNLVADNDKKTINLTLLRRISKHVHHVLLRNCTVKEIITILELCTEVENLALWAIRGILTPLIPLLTIRPIKRLSFDPSCFFMSYDETNPIPFSHSMFHKITHLEIINATPSWTKWHELSSMPNLTHLALAGTVTPELIEKLLEECTELENVLVYYFSPTPPCRFAGLGASRSSEPMIKSLTMSAYTDDLGETWEQAARRIR